MRYFLTLIVSLTGLIVADASSALARLRELFDSVKQFSTDTKDVCHSADDCETLLQSAMKFANNEGTELDHYVEVLKIVLENNIGRDQLDGLAWSAIDRIYEQTIPQKVSSTTMQPDVMDVSSVTMKAEMMDEPSLIKESMETVIMEMDESSLIKESMETIIQSGLGKRGIENSEIGKKRIREERDPESIKRELISNLGNLKGKHPDEKWSHGLMYLRYHQYQLALNGQYSALLYNYNFLENAVSHYIYLIFEDALKVLENPQYRPGPNYEYNVMKSVAFIEERRSVEPTRDRILLQMRKYFDGQRLEYKPMGGRTFTLSDKMLEMAKAGDYGSLRNHIDLLDYSFVTKVRMRSILKATHEYLQQGK